MDPLLSRFLDLAEAAPSAPAALGAAKALGRTAVGGLESWSRGELARRIKHLGTEWRSALASHDHGPGAVIALRVEPGPGMLAAFLACRAAEACVLLLDSSVTQEEEREIVARLGACCVWDSSQSLRSEDLASQGVRWLSGSARLPESACLKLTSGSTGEPAGVRTSPGSLLLDGKALAESMRLSSSDRILASVPLSHSYGLSVIASPAWLVGSAVIFPGDGDPLQAAREFGATFMPSIPSWFEAQVAATSPPVLPDHLRLFMSAGAPLQEQTAKDWLKRYDRGIHVLYGSSECGGIAYDIQGDAACRGSVGTVMDGVRVELDESGQVSVHTPKVTLGYWPADNSRADKIQGDRFQTEDLAHFENGELFLDGRRSQWINVKGKKVNPREVERVLREHPAISDAAVFGRSTSETPGERVRAVIVCEQDALQFADVMAWCKSRIAPHKYPRSVAFCRELPRTERGKLDRKALILL
jgi:long-chain acyl-CoA synthetase